MRVATAVPPRASVALVLLVACGATPPSPTTTPTSAPNDAGIEVPIDASIVVLPSPLCGSAEDCHHEAEDREADGDFAAAARAYGRACEFGDGASCFAGGILLRGRIDPPDEKGSHEAFGKACELRVPDGCAQLGTNQLTGVGGDANPAAGRASLQRACNEGSGLGCHNLGVIVRDGTLGATKDAAAAYALFQDGCRLGRGASCTEQAIALHDGNGAKRDPKRAAVLAEQACNASAEQCWFLAELHGKAKRYREARALHDKACGAGSRVACHNLAVMFEKGLGGAKDAARAKEAYAKACALGVDDDCAR